jgi:hypothetical protein
VNIRKKTRKPIGYENFATTMRPSLLCGNLILYLQVPSPLRGEGQDEGDEEN